MSQETNDMVLNIIKNINDSDVKNPSTQNQNKEFNKPTEVTETKTITTRGKPKSGRFWKSQKERFSSIVKTKGIRPDFQRKTALRIELKRTKELSKQIQEQIKEKEQNRKERRRENLKRTEENKKKSEIVQVITNTAKLKRMKKKQLRFIEKRDTNKEPKSVK
ncbi:coiled-coil domain-containing protein 86 [Bicyclus anynana]|uniref:Coiled-coil domain-containing protein 86 n=1 Tax=Bicyclus anynana TaxID=110368 RepID=A0A6J1NGE0_BICAN|nr:coiled-coil domain-containing protein 86 [Bicyclus anynana]